MVPLKELNLTNRFLFDEVMEDPATQQEVLIIVFGREIPLLKALAETCNELGVSKDVTLQKIMQKFDVSEEDAERILAENW